MRQEAPTRRERDREPTRGRGRDEDFGAKLRETSDVRMPRRGSPTGKATKARRVARCRRWRLTQSSDADMAVLGAARVARPAGELRLGVPGRCRRSEGSA